MPRNNTAELILGANSQRLRQGLSAGSRDIQNFSTRTKTMLAGLGASLKRNLLSIPGQLGLVGGTAGLFMLGRNIVKFDEQLNRLGIQGNMTKAALMGLREETFKVALQAGKSRADIVTGMEQIIERTGNVKFAVGTFKDLTIAARATGAEMADLGGLASQLDEKFGIKPEGLMSALDILTGQGKAGAFTLKDLSGLGARLFSTASRLNMAGEADVAKIGAFAQIAMGGTGTAEQATTAVERTLSALIEKEKVINTKLGFNLKDRSGKYKALDEMLKGIVVAVKGDEAKLQDIFGEMGIRAVSQLASAFRKTGKFERFDEFLFGNFKGTIAADFQTGMQSISAQLGRTLALAEKIGESSMLPSLEKINKAMQDMLNNPAKLIELDNRFKSFGKTISSLVDAIGFLAKNWKVLLGGFALFKGLNLARSFGLFGGKGGASALGGAMGAGGPAIPVYVTNMGSGFGGGLRNGTSINELMGGGASGVGPKAGGLVGLARFVPQVAIAAGVIAAGYYGIKKLNEAGEEYRRKHYKWQGGTMEDIAKDFAPGYRDRGGAPPVSLNVPISVKVDIDKNGKYSGSADVNSPPGVDMQSHLLDIFVGGSR